MNLSNFLPLSLGLIIFSFLFTAVLVVPFIDVLYKIKLVRRKEGDAGGKKKSLLDRLHDKKAGTPVGGGILLVAVISVLFGFLMPVISSLGVFVSSSFGLGREIFVLFVAFLSFAAIGLLDDIVKIFGKPRPGNLGAMFGLSKKQKFILQWVAGLLLGGLLHWLLGIRIIHVPLFDLVFDIGLLYVPFSAFVIVFFANAFNITDGLDGLSSGLLMIYIFAYIIIAVGNLDTPIFIFLSLWLGSLMAFLYFNIPPARIFLGDTGALSFGATIAVIGLIIGNVTTLFIIGGIFVLEAVSSLVQMIGWRYLQRPLLPIAPFHHALEAIGWEEPKIVMRAWLAGVMLAIFGLWLATI